MPRKPPRPCPHPGCLALVTADRPCPQHPTRGWAGRGSPSSRGYGAAWRARRAQILARDGGTCVRCGAPATHVDHVVPKHRGGTDDGANLAALCARCHRTKSGREGRAARDQ